MISPAAGTVRWRRLDAMSWIDECVFGRGFRGWSITGQIEATLDGHPARIVYSVLADAAWTNRRAAIALDRRPSGDNRSAQLRRGKGGRWSVDGVPRPDLAPCLDVDLEMSPATNTLPIRRLGLREGGTAEVSAAWIRFPALRVEPLRQRYTRIDADRYRYRSLDSGFTVDLTVDENGFVVDYPGTWSRS